MNQWNDDVVRVDRLWAWKELYDKLWLQLQREPTNAELIEARMEERYAA